MTVRRPVKAGDRRTVPLPANAFRGPLGAWLKRHPTHHGPLWVNRLGRPLSLSGFNGEIYRVGHDLSLRLNHNRFRHTLATELLGKGVRLETIGWLYGHSNPRSTLHYARFRLEAVRRELEVCQVPGYDSNLVNP